MEKYYEAFAKQKKDWFSNSNDGPEVLVTKLTIKNVEINILELVYKQILARHESLRTVFANINNTIFQKVLLGSKEDGYYIRYFKNTTNDYTSDSIKNALVEKMVDLAKPPLFYVFVQLCPTSSSANIYIGIHHIISDEWSMSILANEFMLAYKSYLQGTAYSFQQLPLQLKDYSSVKNKELTLNRTKFLRYWHNKLDVEYRSLLMERNLQLLSSHKELFQNKELNPQSIILTELERPDVAYQYTFEVIESLSNEVKALAKDYNVSYFAIVCSVFILTLFSNSTNIDVLFSTIFRDRYKSVNRNIIGHLIGDLLLRIEVNKESSFKELVQKCYLEILKSLKYLIYDYEPLQLPTKETIFFHINYIPQSPGLAYTPYYESGHQKISNVFCPLYCVVVDTDKGCFFTVNYNNSFFSSYQIERLGSQYIRILNLISQFPDASTQLIIDTIEY